VTQFNQISIRESDASASSNSIETIERTGFMRNIFKNVCLYGAVLSSACSIALLVETLVSGGDLSTMSHSSQFCLKTACLVPFCFLFIASFVLFKEMRGGDKIETSNTSGHSKFEVGDFDFVGIWDCLRHLLKLGAILLTFLASMFIASYLMVLPVDVYDGGNMVVGLIGWALLTWSLIYLHYSGVGAGNTLQHA